MFRDRTNLFISYRRTFPHHSFDKKYKKTKSHTKKTRFDLLPEEEQGLISPEQQDEFADFEISDDDNEGPTNIHDDTGEFDDLNLNDGEMGGGSSSSSSALPPVFIDIADEIDSLLQEIDQKTGTLTKLYKKNLLPGFNDRSVDEEEIEKLNYFITSKFQSCFALVKRLDNIRKRKTAENSFKNKSEVIMLDNIKKNYALKIQQASSNFRKIQNNYIKFLKEDDFEPITTNKSQSTLANEFDPVLEELETAEVEQYSRDALLQTQSHLQQSNQLDSLVRQREQEINKIAKGVLEVSAIFKEMQTMVIEQGTILDRIDYNLENTKVDLRSANKELTKATEYQKQNNKCKVIFLLVLVVCALLMILIVKPKKHGGDGHTGGNGSNNGKESNGGSGNDENVDSNSNNYIDGGQ
ncbi:Tlg2 protein [Saccharomycopsis crataegensis]|uniref:Tlg2 protein n=1 Tax=Saccharomycopsis crataegensis TaxID=43959 RepID=A0AAV5QEM0_9ASCO|nr:Tlg2 protein [Saccharomycopsis crataegensis]